MRGNNARRSLCTSNKRRLVVRSDTTSYGRCSDTIRRWSSSVSFGSSRLDTAFWVPKTPLSTFKSPSQRSSVPCSFARSNTACAYRLPAVPLSANVYPLLRVVSYLLLVLFWSLRTNNQQLSKISLYQSCLVRAPHQPAPHLPVDSGPAYPTTCPPLSRRP